MLEKLILKKIVKKTIQKMNQNIDKNNDVHLLNLFNTGIIVDIKKIKVKLLKSFLRSVENGVKKRYF